MATHADIRPSVEGGDACHARRHQEGTVMIITQSPLRISLGGGGTDLPSCYREFGGFVIAAGISKHVYVSVQRAFSPGCLLRYSHIEHVQRKENTRPPSLREAVKLLGLDIN